jgi:hypothetical protein
MPVLPDCLLRAAESEPWHEQFGAIRNDAVSSVAVDADDAVFVAGGTTGELASPPRGGIDAFVTKFAD